MGFKRPYRHKFPIMKCDTVLRSGYIYPRELWDRIINEKMYLVPILGEKNDNSTQFGNVTNVELEGDTVYITVEISRDTTWGDYIYDNYISRGKRINAKPFLLCHLNGKTISPDDFILNNFYLVDYSEDVQDYYPNGYNFDSSDGSNSSNESILSSLDTNDTKVEAAQEINISMPEIKEVKSDEEMLKDFLAISSDTEKLFKN